MAQPLLPTQFANLEPLVGTWALATQNERAQKRATSTPEELRTVYSTLLPRLDQVLEFLNQFPLDTVPESARPLLYLALSFAEIAPFVECYRGQSYVPNSFEETRFLAVHGDRVG